MERMDNMVSHIKGAVPRNSAKLGNYKMRVKSKTNIKITA